MSFAEQNLYHYISIISQLKEKECQVVCVYADSIIRILKLLGCHIIIFRFYNLHDLPCLITVTCSRVKCSHGIE